MGTDASKIMLLSVVAAAAERLPTIPQLAHVFRHKGWSKGAIQKALFNLKNEGRDIIENPPSFKACTDNPIRRQVTHRAEREEDDDSALGNDSDVQIVSEKLVNGPPTPQQTPKRKRMRRQEEEGQSTGKRRRIGHGSKDVPEFGFGITPPKTPTKPKRQKGHTAIKMPAEEDTDGEQEKNAERTADRPDTTHLNGVTDDVIVNNGGWKFSIFDNDPTDPSSQLMDDGGFAFVTFMGDSLIDAGF